MKQKDQFQKFDVSNDIYTTSTQNSVPYIGRTELF